MPVSTSIRDVRVATKSFFLAAVDGQMVAAKSQIPSSSLSTPVVDLSRFHPRMTYSRASPSRVTSSMLPPVPLGVPTNYLHLAMHQQLLVAHRAEQMSHLRQLTLKRLLRLPPPLLPYRIRVRGRRHLSRMLPEQFLILPRLSPYLVPVAYYNPPQ